DLDRKEVAEHQSERACDGADHEGVEQQNLGGIPAACPLWTDVFDERPPRWDRNEHGVKRKHEAHEGADTREQRLAPALWRYGDREQLRVERTRHEVDVPPFGEALQRRPGDLGAGGVVAHKDQADLSPRTSYPLGVPDRRHGYRAMH